MNDLLIIKEGEPLLDSRVAARELGVEHQNLRELIEGHSEVLGVIRFQTGKPTKGSKGGRPERWALLDEEQALLLITMVKNTDAALEKKQALVRAFLAMRSALMETRISKVIRRELTDAIKTSKLNEDAHGWGYKLVTDLVYKIVLGMDAKHFRAAMGLADDAVVREHLTSVQLVAVERLEKLAESMIQLGASYEKVKESIMSFGVKALPGAAA